MPLGDGIIPVRKCTRTSALRSRELRESILQLESALVDDHPCAQPPLISHKATFSKSFTNLGHGIWTFTSRSSRRVEYSVKWWDM